VPIFRDIAFTAPFAEAISMVVVVFLITYVSIVIGELVPKTIALNSSMKMAMSISRPIHIVSIIFYPFVKLLSVSTTLFNKIIGLKPKEEIVSEMELRAMLKTASNEGVIDMEENVIHEQVFYFSDKRAIHLMTHRTDIEWVDIDKSREEIIHDLLHTRHSKILACKKRIDDFIGTISMRDFLLRLNSKKTFAIDDLIVEPLIIPNTFRAQKVLERLKKKHKFMAVVVDEYGSIDGIITMHDIIEHLVGAIPEETETTVEPLIFFREDRSALVSGEAPVEILSQIDEDFVVDFDEIDYSTIAGLVFACINKIPSVGDKFTFENLSFEIVDVDGNRTDKVLVEKIIKNVDEAMD
jgi:putative hemolysin